MSGAGGYRRIVDDIHGRVASGALPPGARLPKGSDLCSAYGVSRDTLGRAMLVLRTQGLLVGDGKRAIYVTADPMKIRELGGETSPG